jgi:hypothetical protein
VVPLAIPPLPTTACAPAPTVAPIAVPKTTCTAPLLSPVSLSVPPDWTCSVPPLATTVCSVCRTR